MGYYHEPHNSPMYLFRIAKGIIRNVSGNSPDQYRYASEMSLEVFFKESDAPSLVKKNLKDWLRGNGYKNWLKEKRFE